jgi:hypothetical protein
MTNVEEEVSRLSTELADLRRQLTTLLRLLGQNPAEGNARSISAFCRRQGISRGSFYNLQKVGKAPRVMALGKRRTIAPEAERAWELDREAEAEALKGRT